MKTPAAIITSEMARYPGWTIAASSCGANEVYVHFSSPTHSLLTGKASRTTMKVIKSATPADDTIAPDFAIASRDKQEC